MNNNNSLTFTGRIRSIRHALAGIRVMIASQHNAWIHAAVTMLVVAVGLSFGLTRAEWCWIVLAVISVWTAEALNTAFEFLTDVASPAFHPLAARAKDVAAGAVLITAVGSIAIGLLVFGPHAWAEVGRWRRASTYLLTLESVRHFIMTDVREDPSKKSYVRAGELARAAGVSTDTLRHYERKGVLPKPRRSANGYREYPPEALARVLLVRRALAFGFTLDELARIVKVRDQGGAPCREVRAIAGRKLTLLEARVAELQAACDRLRTVLQHWDTLLGTTAEGKRAALLEALDGFVEPGDAAPLVPPGLRGRPRRS